VINRLAVESTAATVPSCGASGHFSAIRLASWVFSTFPRLQPWTRALMARETSGAASLEQAVDLDGPMSAAQVVLPHARQGELWP
jgi:hypothetical protein